MQARVFVTHISVIHIDRSGTERYSYGWWW